jgi:hypothetical protein
MAIRGEKRNQTEHPKHRYSAAHARNVQTKQPSEREREREREFKSNRSRSGEQVLDVKLATTLIPNHGRWQWELTKEYNQMLVSQNTRSMRWTSYNTTDQPTALSLALLIDLISLLHTSIENGTRWEILASKCSYKREIELDALNNSNSNQFGSSRASVQMVNTTHLIRKEVCSNDRRQASLRRQAFNQRRSFTVFNAIELDQCH